MPNTFGIGYNPRGVSEKTPETILNPGKINTFSADAKIKRLIRRQMFPSVPNCPIDDHSCSCGRECLSRATLVLSSFKTTRGYQSAYACELSARPVGRGAGVVMEARAMSKRRVRYHSGRALSGVRGTTNSQS